MVHIVTNYLVYYLVHYLVHYPRIPAQESPRRTLRLWDSSDVFLFLHTPGPFGDSSSLTSNLQYSLLFYTKGLQDASEGSG